MQFPARNYTMGFRTLELASSSVCLDNAARKLELAQGISTTD
jgi:hypothetical protein